MLDEALGSLECDPRLEFTLDGHVALVDDYLELRPESLERIRALNCAGRLHIGPWYTQADTLLSSGEALIRNLAYGIRRATELGGAMLVGYMPDQFGHAAQIPQMLRLFGIDGAVLWRGVGPERPPHQFRWISPDGSAVTAMWLQDGYGSGRRLPSDPQGFADAIDRTFERLGDWIGEAPFLVPIGDDHVRLATWLPDAAQAVRDRHPTSEVTIGGYHDHLPRLAAATHCVYGELRSPAFAPVLAEVASARVREKQATTRATNLLLRYAEPLSSWVQSGGGDRDAISRTRGLMARAWRQLLLNHAHDSAAGCGVDVAHEDVKARSRWAEQLARTACEQSITQIGFESTDDLRAVAFCPTAARSAVFVTQVPKSLEGPLFAIGADQVARPVQNLGATAEPPVFEGEFSTAELGQYLGGLDPATPLFGKFLTGIVATPMSETMVRLDVGLGETPVAHGKLASDQQLVQMLINKVERFKIVLHGSAATRPVLVQSGPTPEAGFATVKIVSQSSAKSSRADEAIGDASKNRISAGTLSVEAAADGTVMIHDSALPMGAIRANDLVDEGDRGDLYHFDLAGQAVRSTAVRVNVLESGPVRARMRIEQDLELPIGVGVDRKVRSTTTRTTTITTEISLIAGEKRVEFVTEFDNQVYDHRLRALVHVPFHATALDVEHGLSVVSRPLDPQTALGSGTERAAKTGQHHDFVDVYDGSVGVALMSPGLPEHEAVNEPSGTRIALTLSRSVGWLSRGDLSVIDHAAGPMVPTPGAQEIGQHRFEYAVVPHRGDWAAADLYAESAAYCAPPLPVKPSGKTIAPLDRALISVSAPVRITAIHPAETRAGVVVRLLNASSNPQVAQIAAGFRLREAVLIDPLEKPIGSSPAENGLTLTGQRVEVPLRPWQIATLVLQ